MKRHAAKERQAERGPAAGQRRRGSGLEAAGPDQARQERHRNAMQNGPYSAAQRKQIEGWFGPSALAPAQRQENKTGMPDDVKNQMETALHADFSDVRVHPDSAQAPEVGALAYTQGNDVHFAPGQFRPDSTAGQDLLGHELTHVVQQREGRVRPTTEVGGVPVNDDPSLEQEADALGSQASHADVTSRQKRLDAGSGAVPQRSEPDDALVQGKFALQRQLEDEEDLMQGKFAPLPPFRSRQSEAP